MGRESLWFFVKFVYKQPIFFQWCQLQQRKLRFIELLLRMQKYQMGVQMGGGEELPDDVRLITEEDLDE